VLGAGREESIVDYEVPVMRVGPSWLVRVVATALVLVGSFVLLEMFKDAVVVPWLGASGFVDFAILAPLAIPTVVLAPKVSYRARDSWWWFFPMAGFYLLAVCVWRSTLLPYRNWPPRVDERHAVVFCPGLVAGGRPVYRLDLTTAAKV
jgi:hypothetical protein